MAEKQEILVANLTLDTYQKNNIKPLAIPQGDYGARIIRVKITEQGYPVICKQSDAASIVAKRSGDGESKAFSGKVNEDGTVNLPITQWMLEIADEDVICHAVVTGSDYQYATNSFIIEPQEKENPAELSADDPRQDIVTEILANETARQEAEAERATKFEEWENQVKIGDCYYTGELISFKKHPFKIREIVSAPYTVHQGVQGFDIHNGIIAQFESDYGLRLIELETGETVAEYLCPGSHGSTLAFSKKYANSGDEFPLLYICGGNDPIVYVLRITRSGYNVNARIKYSEAVAGYWATTCYDFDRRKMYVCGYTENSYSDNTSGNNLLKLTTWDMSNITNNDDGTISYALESTVTLPFVYCAQSIAFHDGKVFELISAYGNENTEIRVIDPSSGNVLSEFKKFTPPLMTGEAEGLTFADVDDSFQMIVSAKGADKFSYYGFTF